MPLYFLYNGNGGHTMTDQMDQVEINNKDNEDILKSKKTIDVGNDWVLPLMQRGVVVKLQIKQWSGICKLNPEDLGLTNYDESTYNFQKKYISLGTEKLFPPESLSNIRKIVTQAKQNLGEHSFNTLWGSFVPVSAFLEWEQNNNRLKNEFKEAVCNLGENYNNILTQVKEDYRSMAYDVWHRLYPNQGAPTESFISDYIAKQIEKIPDVTTLLMSFDYKEDYYSVALPGLVEQQISIVEEEKRNQEFLDEKTQNKIIAEKRINEIFIEKREEMIGSFLEDTILGLRKHIGKICDEVLLSLSKNENSINKKHQHKILNMLKKVEYLNFYYDKEVEEMLDDLKKDVLKPNVERVDENVIIKLTNISNKVKEEINPDFNENIEFMDF